MQQFAVENERMNLSEEMMDDALIDAVRARGRALQLSFTGPDDFTISSCARPRRTCREHLFFHTQCPRYPPLVLRYSLQLPP